MLVPRSYKYSSSPPRDPPSYHEKQDPQRFRRSSGDSNTLSLGMGRRTSVISKRPSHPDVRPDLPSDSTVLSKQHTRQPSIPSKPVDVPVADRNSAMQKVHKQQAHQQQRQKNHYNTMPSPAANRSSGTSRRKTSFASSHTPDSLPPAVAALLAVTEIPRPRAGQFRRKPVQHRRISIDELVNEWKSEGVSYGSSPSLSVLLEGTDDTEDDTSLDRASCLSDEILLHARTRSTESIPALDPDDGSITSINGPSTPGSLRSRRSNNNLRKEKQISLPSTVDQSHDHPLLPERSLAQEDDDKSDALSFGALSDRTVAQKSKKSFKSNLTASLQTLKTKAISSISSFTLGSSNSPTQPSSSTTLQWSDEMLWSHPFLFPRLSTEIRPSIHGTPTEAQRRYLNPTPLVFEEQEAPFQQALHAPYLAEHLQAVDMAPTIQMQTYSRYAGNGRRRNRRGSSTYDSQPDVDRSSPNAAGVNVRQREMRENSDFLRVVVLEMNMRREGKLETGKAKIWLPPRHEITVPPVAGRHGAAVIPRRWQSINADDL